MTIGQFMLFRRETYRGIGGYEAVRNEMIDDVRLGRLAAARGYRVRLLDGREAVKCRMYSGFWDAVDGFSKNVFAFFGYHALFYLVAWYLIARIYLYPPLAILAHVLGNPPLNFPLSQALLITAEEALLWGMAYYRFRLPIWMALLYPLNMLIFVLIAMRSLFWSLTGQSVWKGRTFSSPLRW